MPSDQPHGGRCFNKSFGKKNVVPAIDTKTCSFRNSLARCVQQAKHDPEAIFELRWSARIPLARPGGAGHDGKTSWYGSNHNDVCRELAQPAIHTKTCPSQLDRSLCTAGETCVLKSCLSFAGPREYRWQGLKVPAMMGKRRGTAQIATASLGVCAASNRHKNLLLFATRSLAVYSRSNMILKPSLSFAGPRECRWQGLEVPAMMGKRRGAAQSTTTSGGSLRSQLSTQKPALLNSIARSVWQL